MRIDLSPTKQPKALKSKFIIKRFIISVFCSILIVFIVNVYFSLTLDLKKAKLSKSKEKYKLYLSLQNDVSDLEKQIDSFNSRRSMYKKMLYKRFLWSEKLVQLAKIIPEEMWLRKLTLETKDENELLRIHGSLFTLNKADKPIWLLNNFIKTIQTNNNFFKDFSDIYLIDTRTISTNNKEVLDFNMELILK